MASRNYGKRISIIVIVGFLVLLACLGFWTWVDGSGIAQEPPNAVVMLEPIGVLDGAKDVAVRARFSPADYAPYYKSKESGRNCVVYLFPDGMDAVGGVENGDTFCDGDVMPELTAATVTVWSVYAGTNYTGARLDGITTYAPGCSDGSQFALGAMPSGWDNITSSMKASTAAGCNVLSGYTEPSLGGGVITARPNLGSLWELDNTISSLLATH